TFVNAADYAVWRDDPADGTRTYGEWSAAFGGVQPVLAVTVPEPSAAAGVVLVGCFGLALRRADARE
ncbi:MAG: PEP-CTERM sorting domain-containing protein, partial [Planctomycetota bacterium]